MAEGAGGETVTNAERDLLLAVARELANPWETLARQEKLRPLIKQAEREQTPQYTEEQKVAKIAALAAVIGGKDGK